VTYTYHASVPGLRTVLSLQQPTGSWNQTNAFDAAKRLSSFTSPAGVFAYTYRGPGNLWTNLRPAEHLGDQQPLRLEWPAARHVAADLGRHGHQQAHSKGRVYYFQSDKGFGSSDACTLLEFPRIDNSYHSDHVRAS
jgi:hypothetical protein